MSKTVLLREGYHVEDGKLVAGPEATEREVDLMAVEIGDKVLTALIPSDGYEYLLSKADYRALGDVEHNPGWWKIAATIKCVMVVEADCKEDATEAAQGAVEMAVEYINDLPITGHPMVTIDVGYETCMKATKLEVEPEFKDGFLVDA